MQRVAHISDFINSVKELRQAQKEYMLARSTPSCSAEERERLGQDVGQCAIKVDGFLAALDPSRLDVFEAIDGERDYQEDRWGDSPQAGQHGVAAWLTFMDDYLTEAKHQCSRSSDMTDTMHTVRKVTTLGVALMEQHGAPRRGDI